MCKKIINRVVWEKWGALADTIGLVHLASSQSLCLLPYKSWKMKYSNSQPPLKWPGNIITANEMGTEMLWRISTQHKKEEAGKVKGSYAVKSLEKRILGGRNSKDKSPMERKQSVVWGTNRGQWKWAKEESSKESRFERQVEGKSCGAVSAMERILEFVLNGYVKPVKDLK